MSEEATLPIRPMSVPPDVSATLPERFLTWYRNKFTSARRIYGHWSAGPYGKVFQGYHQCIAVEAEDLDALVDKLQEARDRRIGGYVESFYKQLLETKADGEVKVYEIHPLDRDLPHHTPKRGKDSIAVCMLCGLHATPKNLGYVEPLAEQIQVFVEVVAEDCMTMNIPVENFMTHAEAADNRDFPAPDDPAAPHKPYGYKTTGECWDLELWVEPWTLHVYPPTHRPSGAMLSFGDYVRSEVLKLICEKTRHFWDVAALDEMERGR